METLLRFDGPTWTHSRIAPQRTHVVTANTHQCFPTNWNLFLPVSGLSGGSLSGNHRCAEPRLLAAVR
jgi:hypothetical protein